VGHTHVDLRPIADDDAMEPGPGEAALDADEGAGGLGAAGRPDAAVPVGAAALFGAAAAVPFGVPAPAPAEAAMALGAALTFGAALALGAALAFGIALAFRAAALPVPWTLGALVPAAGVSGRGIGLPTRGTS